MATPVLDPPAAVRVAPPGAATPARPVAPAFEPYVPAQTDLPELTAGAVGLGVLLGLVFAASSVYLALKIGLTVSASIPIAVLSITIFRWLTSATGGRPSILRNNIVQTTGSAGESIAAGTVFTLPALLLLGYSLPWTQVAAIALVGGLLGVLLMIPLRRSLIVEEHANLVYPEGTACAEVLIAGEKGGTQAKTVFAGFFLGAAYKFLNSGAHLWAEVPRKTFERVGLGGRRELFGEIQMEVSPELAGVGYIIGPKIAGYLFGGGVVSFFVLIPAIKFFGAALATPVAPATKLIADMTAMEVRANYVYYIGAGAVTMAGLISLARSLPTILGALAGGLRRKAPGATAAGRTAPRPARPRRPPRARPADGHGRGRGAAARGGDGAPAADRHQRRGGAARPLLRVPVRHRVEPHHRADRLVGQPDLGDDGRDRAAHGADLPGRGVDRRRAPRAGAVDRRRGVRGRGRGRRHVAGPQDRLHRGRHAGAAADRADRGRDDERAAHRLYHPGARPRVHHLRPARLRGRGRARRRGAALQPRRRPAGRRARRPAPRGPPVRADGRGAGRALPGGRRRRDPLPRGPRHRRHRGDHDHRPPRQEARQPQGADHAPRGRRHPHAEAVVGADPGGRVLRGRARNPRAVVAARGRGAVPADLDVGGDLRGGAVRWLAERAQARARGATGVPGATLSDAEAESGPGVLLSSGLIAGGAITGIVLAALAAYDLSGGIDMEARLGAIATNPAVAALVFVAAILVPLYRAARRAA
jgi:hypothetical protein